VRCPGRCCAESDPASDDKRRYGRKGTSALVGHASADLRGLMSILPFGAIINLCDSPVQKCDT